jgi:hypothetical protein
VADREILLVTLPRGDGRDELRVRLCEYRGRAYVDVRVWSRPEGETQFKPAKGCTIKLRELAAVAGALDEATQRIDGQGRMMVVLEKRGPDPTETW